MLIKNGLIYDGNGGPPYEGDIVIKNGKIETMNAGINSYEGEIIEARNKIVTPGFIDTHRHCDFAVLNDTSFGTTVLAQGITTVLCGNCGMSPFPAAKRHGKAYYTFLKPCLGNAPENMYFTGIDSYMEIMEKSRPAVNIGLLIGTGAVKAAVMGFKHSPFTLSKIKKAQGFLLEALTGGVFGISSGLMYVPECYWNYKDYINLFEAVKKYNPVLTIHVRGEGDSLIHSIEEAVLIGRNSGLPINISHFKSAGMKNWHSAIYKAIDIIESSGWDITADFYPYTGGATTMLSLIPPTVMKDTMEKTIAFLGTREGVDAVKKEYTHCRLGWDNMAESIGWERILYEGKSINETEPVDFICKTIYETQGKAGIITMSMHRDDLDAIVKLPWTFLISDSLYGESKNPHPRLHGAFPKFLRNVRERKIIPMEEAIHKMTAKPAVRYGINSRGILKAGYTADINIFDPLLFTDNAAFKTPTLQATGMAYVLLAGEIVYENGTVRQKNKGRVLTKNY